MPVEPIAVSAETYVQAEPERVAAIMFDPAHDREWMAAVKQVQPPEGGLRPGARVRRRGSFLGRSITWETEVVELRNPDLLRLRIVTGPIRGQVTYEIGAAGRGSIIRILNVGDARGIRWLPRPLLAVLLRRTLRADLRRLAGRVRAGV
ncbi:MAG TPA: SRPBCC family protein [Gemmatimonadales bacterium]|nr:SRPBCC family protein [Gemmatimonadales bacterium]